MILLWLSLFVKIVIVLNASMLELVYKSVSKTDALNWAAGSSPAGSTFFSYDYKLN